MNLRKILLVAGVVVVMAFFFFYFSIGKVLKKGIETFGPKATKSKVEVGRVWVSPFSGKGGLHNIEVGNPIGYTTPYAIRIRNIQVSVDPKSLKSDTIVVNRILIDGPEINYEGGMKGSNLSKIQENVNAFTASPSDTSKGGSSKPAKKIKIKELDIQNASIHATLNLLGNSTSSGLSMPDIHLKNIGEASGGVTPAQVVSQVLGQMIRGIRPGISTSAKDLKSLFK